jgi:two-component system chemotaxis response regulator CheY
MKKILLTSASKTFLRRNSSLLMNKGFQFFTSSSGMEALKLHEEHHFDLILSDLELGDMDGCRLCSEVRKTENPHPAPVILICFETVESIERVKKSDACAILFRPINPTHLLITIGSFIDMQLARNKRVVFNAKVLSKTEDREFFCNSHDISISGILLETDHHLDLRCRITCQVTIPEIRQIQMEGEVARCFSSPAGKKLYGVKFIELPLTNRSAIEKYVASNNHLEIKQKPSSSFIKELRQQF